MTRRPLLLMLMACAAVLAQQQLLLRQPPRLLRLVPQQVQSGSAALDLQFSRPMDRPQGQRGHPNHSSRAPSVAGGDDSTADGD